CRLVRAPATLSTCPLSLHDALPISEGIAPNKMSILPNGVDTDRVTPRPKSADLAEYLGVSDSVVIGYVGSVVHYEGIDSCLQARSEEHTSELQSRENLVCRLLLEKK